MKIAIVKDFLPLMRGAEKVLEVWCRLWPQADIYALFHNRGRLSPTIERHRIRTSFLQKMPFVRKRYRYYLPLMPTAIEGFRLNGYDVVLSLSQCVAKGVRPNGATHVCYCLTPMRYVWDMVDLYFPSRAARPLVNYLRAWDQRSADRVDRFVAISSAVAERIRRIYGRSSDVVHPPVNDEFYTPDETVPREDFYLVVSRLVKYKRFELSVEACLRTGRRLVVIGSGPQKRALLRRAGGRVTFLGWQPDEVLRDYYRRCRAMLFPGEEDFGIVMAEAQLCGAPVIAYGRGGARDLVIPDETGVLAEEQSAGAMADAMDRFESRTFRPARIQEHARRFSLQQHIQQIRSIVEPSSVPANSC